MADLEELDLVYKAFSLAIGSNGGYVNGYVEWCDDRATRIARSRLADLGGLTPEGIRIEAIEFVRVGGTIEQMPERRPEWSDFAYYYKIILPFDFVPRGVFVEMRLDDPDRNDPVVHLVSAHRQGV
jgi:hypothetical protein